MFRHWLLKLRDVLSVGSRPLRIFFFGGALLAYLIMKILGNLLGMDEGLRGDASLGSAILMTVSILAGFAVSFNIMRMLENIEPHNTDETD